MRILSIIAVYQFCLISIVSANFYTAITDIKGRTLEVTILTHNETHVVCTKKKGTKKLNIPFSSLNEESIATVKKFPLLNATIKVIKNRELDESQPRSAFGDQYLTSIHSSASINNTNTQAEKSEYNAHFHLIATGQDAATFHTALDSQSFTFSFSKRKRVKNWRNQKLLVPSKLRYEGYILFITDKHGRIVSRETSVNSLKGKLSNELFTTLSQLDEDAKLDETFTPIP